MVGVDGCRAGWIAWRHDPRGPGVGPLDASARPIAPGWSVAVHADLASLWDAHADAGLILVDIPIGLGASRACDREAKRRLGRVNSRVFLTPPRAVLEAASYPAANALSRRLTGAGLSKQLWNIGPKIRQADALLRAVAAARGVVRECHPEICFWALAGGAIAANKRTDEGASARLEAIARVIDRPDRLVRGAMEAVPPRDAARDDVIDALVAAATAVLARDRPALARTLPETPERDELGLAMEMVYAVAEGGEPTPPISADGPRTSGTAPRP